MLRIITRKPANKPRCKVQDARETGRDEGEHLRRLCAAVDEETVLDQASAGGSGLCRWAVHGDSGGDNRGLGVFAYSPVNELHYIVAKTLGTGGSDGGVSIVVENLGNEALRLGLTHDDRPTVLDPGIGVVVVVGPVR